MNILYCGDKNIIDGLIISILSLMKNTDRKLNIYVLTMDYGNYQALPNNYIKLLDKVVKKKNKNNFVKLLNITGTVNECFPKANVNTRFTPYCMLRLYADMIDLPSKILYLDNDIVFLKNPDKLYDIDNSDLEIVGVLDNYGSHFFRKKLFSKDYINSGVLLLNLDLISKTGLFEKSRKLLKEKKIPLPDQSAINLYVKKKMIVPRIYNEQKEIRSDTVIRHFTTTIKFFPPGIQTIKPWHIDKLHRVLKTYEIDDILEEYNTIKGEL